MNAPKITMKDIITKKFSPYCFSMLNDFQQFMNIPSFSGKKLTYILYYERLEKSIEENKIYS